MMADFVKYGNANLLSYAFLAAKHFAVVTLPRLPAASLVNDAFAEDMNHLRQVVAVLDRPVRQRSAGMQPAEILLLGIEAKLRAQFR